MIVAEALEVPWLSHNLCAESAPVAVEVLAMSQSSWPGYFHFMVRDGRPSGSFPTHESSETMFVIKEVLSSLKLKMMRDQFLWWEFS